MRLRFLSTSRGSPFMTELLRALAVETEAAGHEVDFLFDRFPPLVDAEEAYIVIPHEFEAWGDPQGAPDSSQRARTIALCTENAGTEWFEATCGLLPKFASSVSINRASAAEVRRRGMRCEHIQLGYSPLWDGWQGDAGLDRPLDLLYLGAADPRRDPLVGGIGRDLWARECQFLIPPLEPRVEPRPDFLIGAEKHRRLCSARILLNLHRSTSAALEWMRFLEAICNGCVVLSEPCLDNDPLIPGEHFIAAEVGDIAAAADRLLDEPERLSALQLEAYTFIRERLPMRAAAERLLEIAGGLSTPVGTSARSQAPPVPPGHPRERSLSTLGAEPEAQLLPPELPPAPQRRTRNGVSDHLGRRWPRRRPVGQTPAFASAAPRVSVTVVLRDPDDGALGTLASVAASRYRELELLIFDASADSRCTATVKAFLEDHPSLPAALVSRGRRSRPGELHNVLAGRARGEHLLHLDPGAEIYPSTLERLVRVLEADELASFAYPMIVTLDGDEPRELLGSLPWDPRRLRDGSWVHITMLIRTEELRRLGGYDTDPQLAGWESFQLLCRAAQDGAHGVHLPQVLGSRQRTSRNTMTPGAPENAARWSLMIARFPGLLGSPVAA